MGDQTWTVTATPLERWTLAVILFNPKLEFTGRQEQKRLYRARRALGLLEPSEAFMIYNTRPGEPVRIGPSAEDRSTRHRFQVTAENADFILGAVEKTPFRGGDTIRLEGLLQQLEDRQDAPGAADAPPYSAEADAAGWRPSLRPVVDQPERLLTILENAFEAQSYGEARRRWQEALAPEPATEAA